MTPLGDVYEKVGASSWALRGNIRGPAGAIPNLLAYKRLNCNGSRPSVAEDFATTTIICSGAPILIWASVIFSVPGGANHRAWVRYDGADLPGRLWYDPGFGSPLNHGGYIVKMNPTPGAHTVAIRMSCSAAYTAYDDVPDGSGYGTGTGDGNLAFMYVAELGSGGSSVPTVTVLPSNPADNTEVYFLADATNGVIWHLRYRAASASPYKWEYVGGGELSAFVDAQQSTVSTSPADLSTVGPQITVPLAGEWVIEIASAAQTSPSALPAGTRAVMTFQVGATGAVVADGAWVYGNATVEASISRRVTKTVTAANTVLLAKYARDINAGTAYFGQRNIRARPVRVG